jgi:ethanolamine permease
MFPRAAGITIVIGGQYFGWNVSSIGVCGWVPFAVATAAISIGYITLCICLAEMTSSMPFAGALWRRTLTL